MIHSLRVRAPRAPTQPPVLELHRGEVGGVPLFWCEAPGPFWACLLYRVGAADETLATRGVTHLVEHLAIPAEVPRGFDCNGTVTGDLTSFWGSGDRTSVLAFLERVAANVADLPLERFEVERSILLTEAESWSPGPFAAAAALRFGTTGHGLAGHEELGLHRLRPEDAATWARERFGRPVVLVMGTPPDEFVVPEPALRARAAPEPETIPDLDLPAVYPWAPQGGVGVSLVARRSVELAVARAVALDRLRERLRFQLGLSYALEGVFEPLTPDVGHTFLSADCVAGREGEVADALLAVLAELAEHGPSEQDLELDAAEFRRQAAEPEWAQAALAYGGEQELAGRVFTTTDELLAEREAVTAGDIASAFAEAFGTALLLVPHAGVRPPGFGAYPEWSTRVVHGRRHRPSALFVRGVRLVVGDAGVSLVQPEGPTTVRFAECVALQRWADGTRVLWACDGTRLVVVPEAWRKGRAAVAAIDAAVVADVLVPMEADAEERTARVAAKLKRTFANADDLDVLAGCLGEGEPLLAAAEGRRGWRYGVVAVTDRRLLFVAFAKLRDEVALADVASVTSEAGTWSRESSLALCVGADELVFRGIGPKERLDDLERAVEPRHRP